MANLTPCNSCNSCQICNVKNQSACLKCQEFGEIFDTFSFNTNFDTGSMCPVNGQFNSTVWNSIYEYINQRVNLPNTNYTTVTSTGLISPFSAKEFNKVANTINAANPRIKAVNVKSNDLILGSYFENLEDAVNTMKMDANFCLLCNIACQSCDMAKQASYGESYCCNGDCTSCETNCETDVPCITCESNCVVCQSNHCGAVQW